MSLPVSQYEDLLAQMRGLRRQALHVQQLVDPLFYNDGGTSNGTQVSGNIEYDEETENRRSEDDGTPCSFTSEPSPSICRSNTSNGSYRGTWPVEGVAWNSQTVTTSTQLHQPLPSRQTEISSVMSFASSAGAAIDRMQTADGALSPDDGSTRSSHQLEAKVDVVYSLLAVLGAQEHADMGETLLALSANPESCIAMRGSGCVPLLVQLVQSDGDLETRRKFSQALRNLVHSQPDEKMRKRETRILKLLEAVCTYNAELKDNPQFLCDNLSEESDRHPIQTVAHLMKLSFDEGHRQAICQLGGIHTIAKLVEAEHTVHGSTTCETHCILMRRYACMALTNLTFGDSANKASLCSYKDFVKALVVQLQNASDELRQVTGSVLRNLSWRADSTSKEILKEAGCVKGLMQSAMMDNKENTLKSILSALWNLSAHCTENKSEICSLDGSLVFLVDMLQYKSTSKSLAIVENAGGILRNISSQIAVRDDYRTILRERNCLQILLDQLKSPSLTIVSNACGTLWNLSAKNPIDQDLLWRLGAPAMLRSLNNSKHRMIAMGSSATLKNLLMARPGHALEPHVDSTALALDLPTLPTLGARKQKALLEDLDRNLSETFDTVDIPSTDQKRRKNRSSDHRIFINSSVDEPSTSFTSENRSRMSLPSSASLPCASPDSTSMTFRNADEPKSAIFDCDKNDLTNFYRTGKVNSGYVEIGIDSSPTKAASNSCSPTKPATLNLTFNLIDNDVPSINLSENEKTEEVTNHVDEKDRCSTEDSSDTDLHADRASSAKTNYNFRPRYDSTVNSKKDGSSEVPLRRQSDNSIRHDDYESPAIYHSLTQKEDYGEKRDVGKEKTINLPSHIPSATFSQRLTKKSSQSTFSPSVDEKPLIKSQTPNENSDTNKLLHDDYSISNEEEMETLIMKSNLFEDKVSQHLSERESSKNSTTEEKCTEKLSIQNDARREQNSKVLPPDDDVNNERLDIKCEGSDHLDQRMLDPDAMIESLDRFTAELVSQASSHLQSNKDSSIYKSSANDVDNTWADTSQNADITFPTMSASAPNVVSFTSSTSSNAPLKKDEQAESNAVEYPTLMTESTLIAIEAKRVVEAFKEAVDDLSLSSANSLNSLDLDRIRPPSHLNSLSNSMIGGFDSKPSSPKSIRKKSFSSNILVKRALTHSLPQAFQSMENLQVEKTDNVDVNNEVEGNKQVISSEPTVHDLDHVNSIHYIDKFNPPSLLFDDSTATVQSIIDTEVFDERSPAVQTESDNTCLELAEIDGITVVLPDDINTSSNENTPKQIFSKQRRSSAKDRYKTYTIDAGPSLKENNHTTSCLEDQPVAKLSPKDRRISERSRFETQIVDPNVVINAAVVNTSVRRQSFNQKRQTNKDRFKTQTLDCSKFSPPNILLQSKNDDEPTTYHVMMEEEVNKVLQSLKDDDKGNHRQQELLECETLSLVSNDDESEYISGCSVNYRTYNKNRGLGRDRVSSDVTRMTTENDSAASNSEDEATRATQIVQKRPKIVKPEESEAMASKATEQPEQPVKSIRGRRKALYSRTNIVKKPIPNNTSSASVKSTPATTTKSVSRPPLMGRSKSNPSSSIGRPVPGSSSTTASSSTKNSPKRRASPSSTVKPPFERQGTFTKDDPRKQTVVNNPRPRVNSKIPFLSAKVATTTAKIPPSKLSNIPRVGLVKSASSEKATSDTTTRPATADPKTYNRSTSVDSRPKEGIPRMIQPSLSIQSLKSETAPNKLMVYQNGAIKKTANTNPVQVNGSNNTKKQVTSKIASIWKKIEECKKKSHTAKDDTKKWIVPQTEQQHTGDASATATDETGTKRISRLGSFITVDDNDELEIHLQPITGGPTKNN